MTTVADKAVVAARDFERVVWPVLNRFVGGTLQQVETQTGTLAADLDCLAGIDAYVRTSSGLHTWACRLQWRHFQTRSAPWAAGKAPMTFTCRCRTEIGKRVAALDNGSLMPEWTLQAYLDRDGGPLENVGWINTRDLYAYVRARCELGLFADDPDIYENPVDHRHFLAVPWLEVGGYRWFRPWPKVRQRQGRLL
jgi:hypothetical protein